MSVYSDAEAPRQWLCCGETLPRSEIVYLSRTIVIYTIIIFCLANLTLGMKPVEIYISLLSTCLGFILQQYHSQNSKNILNHEQNRNERILPNSTME